MSFFDTRMRVLIKNVFGSAAARFVNLFITLAMVPLTINALSPTDYAYFAMAISLSMLAAYADLGMGLAVVNVIAQRSARPNSAKAQRALSVVWFSLLGIAAFGLVLVLLLAGWINFQMTSPSTHQYNAMLLAAACVFAGLPTGLVQRVLFAEQQNVLANAWSTGARVVSLVVAWTLVTAGFVNLYFLVFAVVGIPTLIAWVSVGVVFFQKSGRTLRPDFNFFFIRLLRPYLLLGFSFLVLQSAPYLETGIDDLLIGTFIDISFIPAYDTYSKLFNYAPALISIALFPLWPAIANAKVTGDFNWILRIQRNGYMIVSIVSVITAVFLFLFSESLVMVWVGKILELKPNVLFGLGVLCIFSSVALFQSMLLNGFGQIQGQVRIFLIYAPVVLISKIIAAQFFGLPSMIWIMNICYIWRLYMSNKLISKYTEMFSKIK
jgi:O-antigen/teichoic acid export membrane protein